MNAASGVGGVAFFKSMLGLSDGVWSTMLAAVLLLVVYSAIVLFCCVIMDYLERKVGADLQARVGPNRAGPIGLLQSFADLLKLMQKIPAGTADRAEAFWMNVRVMVLFSTVAVLPLGSAVLLVNTDMTAFIPFWAALFLSLGTMLLGLSQGSLTGWFGGMRVAAQALAGAFPALIAILCAGIRSGGFKWSVLAETQGAYPWSWTAFSSPFEFLAFVVFVISGLVFLSSPPLNGSLSITDIQGGVMARISGYRLGIFRFSRFYAFFLWSLVSVVVFLGAWNLPGSLFDTGAGGVLSFWGQLFELGVVLSKTFAVMLLVIWVARVSPRVRSDQVTDLAWEVLSPLSLLALVGTAFWISWETLI